MFVIGSRPAVLLPATSAAPPARLHAGRPASNDPPESRKYALVSPAKTGADAGRQVSLLTVAAPADAVALASTAMAAPRGQIRRASLRTGSPGGRWVKERQPRCGGAGRSRWPLSRDSGGPVPAPPPFGRLCGASRGLRGGGPEQSRRSRRTGAGGRARSPAPRRIRARRARASRRAISTPSAITRRPSAWARRIVESTMVARLGAAARPVTTERSSLSESTSSSRRYWSDENPVP